jgi:hypothetical protein
MRVNAFWCFQKARAKRISLMPRAVAEAPEVWAPQRQSFFSTVFLSLRAPFFFLYKTRTSGAVLGALISPRAPLR